MRSGKKKSLSFFMKLFICFIVISIVPVMALGTLAYVISANVSMNNLEFQAESTVGNAAKSLERTVGEYESALSFFCTDSEVIRRLGEVKISDDSRTAIYQKMYILLAGKSTTVAMHLIKADGSFQISTASIPELYDIGHHRDWGVYRRLNGSAESIVYSNRYVSQTGRNFCMAVAHTIRNNGGVVAYAIIDLPADVIQTALYTANVSLPIRYLVMDGNDYILYDELFGGKREVFLNSDFRGRIQSSGAQRKFYLTDPQRFVTWASTPGPYPLRIISSVPVELVVMNSNYIMVTTVAVALAAVLLCLILSPLVIRSLTKPLNAIVNTINRVQKGETGARVPIQRNDEFGFIAAKLNAMLDNLNELYETNLEKQNRLRLAELKALYGQINPHFLYNTLDSIKWIAKLNGVDDIVRIVSQLGKLLKNSIRSQKDSVRISEEIALIKSYLSIQEIRYSDKFEAEIQVDDDILECVVPKFIIQPIVENSIIHGIEDKVGRAHLIIRGRREGDCIVFEIMDDGVGISPERLAQIQSMAEAEPCGEESIGISNVDKRIKLYYGENYGLKLISKQRKGTVTRITMPYFDIPSDNGEGGLPDDPDCSGGR